MNQSNEWTQPIQSILGECWSACLHVHLLSNCPLTYYSNADNKLWRLKKKYRWRKWFVRLDTYRNLLHANRTQVWWTDATQCRPWILYISKTWARGLGSRSPISRPSTWSTARVPVHRVRSTGCRVSEAAISTPTTAADACVPMDSKAPTANESRARPISVCVYIQLYSSIKTAWNMI